MTQFNINAHQHQEPPIPPFVHPPLDVLPPPGETSPQMLAQQAADGRRGAAWRLMHLVTEDDPDAIRAVTSLHDDRLAHNLLEFLALGTWAGKSFDTPPSVCSVEARMQLRMLFLPGLGMPPLRSERVLLAAVHDARSPVRAVAVHILGLVGNRSTLPLIVETLHDSSPEVRFQAIKALGRLGDPRAVPELLTVLHSEDEVRKSEIFRSLVQLGDDAVPALIAESTDHSAWIRWQCMHALGEIGDERAVPALVQALADTDHGVAWMAARALPQFGRLSVVPVLRLLSVTETLPWLVETTWYVLHEQRQRHKDLRPYLDPVLHQMHHVGYRVATSAAASEALEQLRASGFSIL